MVIHSTKPTKLKQNNSMHSLSLIRNLKNKKHAFQFSTTNTKIKIKIIGTFFIVGIEFQLEMCLNAKKLLRKLDDNAILLLQK